jgi:hypothetical protein
MRTIRRWRQAFLLTVLAGLLASSAALAPIVAPGAAAQSPLDLYVSDQFEYLFFFDPGLWVIEEETTELDSDYVFLSNGEVFVYYLAFEAPGVSTDDCLRDVLNELAIDTEILSVEPLIPGDGDGSDVEAAITSTATSSTVHLLLTIDEDGEPYKLVTEETCHQIYPDESLLYVSTNVPAELYNELGGDNPFGTVPAIALSLPSIDGRDSATATGQVPLPTAGESGDLDDPLTGILEGHVHCAVDGPPQLLILAYALDNDLTLDTSAFTVTSDGDEETALAFGEWLYPEADPATDLTLEPGDVGLAWFDLPGAESTYDLTYTPPAPDAPITLGQIDPAACAAPGPSFPDSVSLD